MTEHTARISLGLYLRSSGPRLDLLDVFVLHKPVGDIDHHVADSDDGHPTAHFERTLGKAGQPIEMVHHVLGVVDPDRRVPLHANRLRALRSRREDQGAGPEASQVFDRQVFLVADRHVSEIMHVWALHDLPVGLPQSSAQL
jgi:hypothetical protein